ncbi:MAG: LiaF transmembrane domain-containing protein [Terracidiphilus sp.]
MDCVNHSGVSAAAYCQNCGKALCSGCVRKMPAGQILCEPCWMGWQAAQRPFVAPPAGAPSPGLAAVLGLIPGVGAMYNGQFIKGLVHVFIFAVLVSAAHVYGVFGLFIAGWIFYQVFEAYHTAKARRDGEPLPDPLGLNEVSNWFTPGGRMQQGVPPGPQPGTGFGAAGTGQAGSGPVGGFQAPYQAPGAGANQAQVQPPYQSPYQVPYQGPYTPPPPGVPPIPPVPAMYWRRREPIGAVILIGLGLLFLLGQFDWFSGRAFEFTWPILLIGLGVWLIVRRLQETQPANPQGQPQANQQGASQDRSQGGPK